MGGMADSAGGFLGLSDGPKAPGGQFGNNALGSLQDESSLYNDAGSNVDLSRILSGKMSGQDFLSSHPADSSGYSNMLAQNPLIGSRMATQEVQNNPLFSSVYGQNGAMGAMANDLNHQVGQGWSLQPQDQTMYGQAAGQIARNYGQQGNQMANSLAQRGLSSSGAAGAQFSGLAGSQNEQLANAQTQIMQQRFQNTMQQANALNQMGSQAGNLVNQQAGRQLAGAQANQQAREGAAGTQAGANQAQNQYGLQAAQFNVSNKPANAMDYFTSGMGQGLQQQGNNTTNPFNSGGGSPGSLMGNMGGGGGGMMSMMGA